MSLFTRITGKVEVPDETPCPRCAVPAPDSAVECSACGWDMREAYHNPVTGADTEAIR